jgi:hypothetical protein
MKQIVSYLDSRAEKFLPRIREVSPAELMDAYANIDDIATAIGADRVVVWQSIAHLLDSGTAIRILPTTGIRRKRYGSPKLPTLSLTDLASSLVAAVNLKLN